MVAEITRVVAGAVDQRRLAAAQKLHPDQVHAPGARTTIPPSCSIMPLRSKTGSSSQE